MMTIRVMVLSSIVLCSFLAGLIVSHPQAIAAEIFTIVRCSTGLKPCALYANKGQGIGLAGISAQGTGVVGIAGGRIKGVVIGVGVQGLGRRAGVSAQTESGFDAFDATNYSKNPAHYSVITYAPSGAGIWQGNGYNGAMVTIDPNANITTTGLIYTAGACSAGCSRRSHVARYASSSASPTLEDTGEAQLHNGIAYVRLDRIFANAIDPRADYVVLITPEDATAGLYVRQRTLGGFLVRENPGGHSNAAFAYRIVARPYGVDASRLPFVRSSQETP